ncbi:hypothetical protein SYNPS1DRAFT_28666 [Syncephalis pseudoplumigaleata]|uniref:Uncharacterized protein n=1 Tax=Syncephalis pseudoplumigaleata TaxID=1712513 RepID=A0A4P9YZJ6_9FUNG|nr:hypothetical protein SYNPS1DRAFT_28666 [Syncephalis pseudoplumigaleata]|eukprot:RKP25603.1 hypothetical protein SYNPS1DRAFT_28666 [Syncephalis pseudoplumigaleata]
MRHARYSFSLLLLLLLLCGVCDPVPLRPSLFRPLPLSICLSGCRTCGNFIGYARENTVEKSRLALAVRDGRGHIGMGGDGGGGGGGGSGGGEERMVEAMGGHRAAQALHAHGIAVVRVGGGQLALEQWQPVGDVVEGMIALDEFGEAAAAAAADATADEWTG